MNRRFPTGNQALIGVDARIGKQAELGNVLHQARNIVLCNLGKVVAIRVVRIEERVVAVFIEEALVNMHARARRIGEGLRHERCVHTVFHGDFLHNHLVGHDVVGHAERVGETQVDLLLRRAVFVVGVFDGNAHLLQREDGIAAKVACHVERREVEVAALVKHLGAGRILEVVVLELGAYVHHITQLLGFGGLALQHIARVAVEVLAFGRFNGAEHAANRVALRAPRQNLER